MVSSSHNAMRGLHTVEFCYCPNVFDSIIFFTLSSRSLFIFRHFLGFVFLLHYRVCLVIRLIIHVIVVARLSPIFQQNFNHIRDLVASY